MGRLRDTEYRVLRIAEAAFVSPRAPSPVTSTPPTMSMPACSLTFYSQRNFVWNDSYGGEKLEVIDHLASSDCTRSAGTLYSMCTMLSRPPTEPEDVESLMHEIRSACFVLSSHASKTVVALAKVSLGWLREIVVQERASQRRHAVLKPEAGEVTEIKNDDEEAVLYRDPRPVGQSRRE